LDPGVRWKDNFPPLGKHGRVHDCLELQEDIVERREVPTEHGERAPLFRHARPPRDVAEHPRTGWHDDAVVGEDGSTSTASIGWPTRLMTTRRSSATRNGVPSSTTSRNEEGPDWADAGDADQSTHANRNTVTCAHPCEARRRLAEGANGMADMGVTEAGPVAQPARIHRP
jgi:hypothetical protein